MRANQSFRSIDTFNWMVFDATDLRIYGESAAKHLLQCEADDFRILEVNFTDYLAKNVTTIEQSCNITIQLVVTDSFITQSQRFNFTLQLYNYQPYIYYPIEKQSNFLELFQYFHYNDFVYFELFPETFVDPDGDQLTVAYTHQYGNQ